jgi:Rrf2 family protein
MKLTRASLYALHALAFMAQERNNKPMASQNIARARNIPDRFLLKVLKPLVDKGVLGSVKGPNGGYTLNREPSEISLLEIIEAAVPGELTGGVPDEEKLNRASNAALNARLKSICDEGAEVLREYLARVTLADLIGLSKHPDNKRNYARKVE